MRLAWIAFREGGHFESIQISLSEKKTAIFPLIYGFVAFPLDKGGSVGIIPFEKGD